MNDRFKFRFYAVNYKTYVDATIGSFIGSDMIPIWKNGNFLTMEKTTDVIPEQCTGLKDKNGKLIYEGDIVIKSDISAIGYSRTRVCKVHWHNDWLSWAITTQYGDTYELSEFEPQQYEVIGNIHENADLLEIEE